MFKYTSNYITALIYVTFAATHLYRRTDGSIPTVIRRWLVMSFPVFQLVWMRLCITLLMVKLISSRWVEIQMKLRNKKGGISLNHPSLLFFHDSSSFSRSLSLAFPPPIYPPNRLFPSSLVSQTVILIQFSLSIFLLPTNSFYFSHYPFLVTWLRPCPSRISVTCSSVFARYSSYSFISRRTLLENAVMILLLLFVCTTGKSILEVP